MGRIAAIAQLARRRTVTPMTTKPSAPKPAHNRAGDRLTKDGKLGWHCRIYDASAGQQRQVTFYGTEREAVAHIERFRAQSKARTTPILPGARYVTVAQWSLEFLRRYKWKIEPVDGEGGVLRPKTTWNNAKANVSAYIVPNLGKSTRIVSVTPATLNSMIAKLKVRDTAAPRNADDTFKRKPADADTKDKAASITRLMFSLATSEGVLEKDPAKDLRTVWGEWSRQGRVVIPSLQQVEELAEELDAQWPGRGDLVRVFAYTGLRWENLNALDWDDVDFALRSIYVWRSRPSSTGECVEYIKGGHDDGYITIIDEAVEPLRRLRKFALERGSEHVMCGERGGPLSYSLWRKHLNKAREKTGVSYTAHGLRHVCASLLIAGSNPKDGDVVDLVRAQMLHKHRHVTERVYRHAFQVDRRELAARLRMPTTGIEVEESVEE